MKIKRDAVLTDPVSQDLRVPLVSALAQCMELVDTGYPIPDYLYVRLRSAVEEYSDRVRAVRATISTELGDRS